MPAIAQIIALPGVDAENDAENVLVDTVHGKDHDQRTEDRMKTCKVNVHTSIECSLTRSKLRREITE